MDNNTYEIKNINEMLGLNHIIKMDNSYRDLVLKGNPITKIITNLNIILIYNQKVEIEENLDTFIPSASQKIVLPFLNRNNNSLFGEIIAMGCKNTSLSTVTIYVDIDITLKELLSCFYLVPINHIFVNNTNYDKLIPTIDAWYENSIRISYFESTSLYDSVGDVNIIKQYSKVSYNKFTRTLQIDTDEATAAEISLLLLFDDDK